MVGGSADMPRMGVVVGGTAGVVAMKLLLFLYCRGSASPAVAAFALDHISDVLVNSVGLAGARVQGWEEPVALVRPRGHLRTC